MYYKTEFTKDEEERLEELQKVQSKGLSHITAKIVRLRQLVVDNYMHMFNSVGKDIGRFLNTTQTDGRLLRNMTTVLATFKCLEPALDLPFSYGELVDEAVKNLLRQNELIYNSNELATFWGIVEYLIERGELKEKQNYKIKATSYLKVMDKKGAKNLEFKPDKEVMLLKWAGIYQLYSETARRSGQHPLPESTLTHYLTTCSYYLGKVKSVNFDGIVNSAHAFDYVEIKLNLKRVVDREADYESDDTDRPDVIKREEEDFFPQPKQGRLEV